MHPTPAVGGEPLAPGGAADTGARGTRPRLVRRSGRLDRRRPGTASSASRCAARCCAAASPAAMPATASSASSEPGGRAGRDRGQALGAAPAAGGLSAPRDRLPHARVQLHVRARDRSRTSMMLEPLVRERPLERRAKRRRTSADPLVGEPVQRGGPGEVEARGGGDVAGVDVRALVLAVSGAAGPWPPGSSASAIGRVRDGQEVEDAAAAVVEQHDRQLQLQAPRREQAADVVGERDVADQEDHRARRRRRPRRRRSRRCRRCRWRRGCTARAAGPRAPARRSRCRARASRRRRTASPPRQQDAELGRHRGLGELVAGDDAPRIASAASSSALRQPASQSSSAAARSARARAATARPAGRARARRTGPTSGSCQAPSGSSATWRRRPRPASHVRRGLETGRSPTRRTRSGLMRRGEGARRAAARRSARPRPRRGARRRAGRPAGASRRRRRTPRPPRRRAAAAPALVAPGDEDTPLGAGHEPRSAAELLALERRVPLRRRAHVRRAGLGDRCRRCPGSGSSLTSGSRSGKLRCTTPGPALERRPVGAAGERAHPAQPLGARVVGARPRRTTSRRRRTASAGRSPARRRSRAARAGGRR